MSAQLGVQRGSTLVELLVAIPLGAMLTAVAVMLLLDAHRLARRVNAATGISRELRHAGALLAAELRPLAGSDLVAWTDTSVDLQATMGAGIVCAHPAPNIVDLLPLHPDDVLRTAWNSSPQPGDRAWLLARDQTVIPAPPSSESHVLSNISATASSGCTTSPLRITTTLPPVRLTLLATDTVAPPPGTTVRITRRVHYALYKASDNQWWLGRRSLGPTGWDIIQPAAGPFRTPAQQGLVLHVVDQDDTVINAPGTATPVAITLALRAVSSWKQTAARAGAQDSLLLRIALRGEASFVAPPAPIP